MKQPSIKELLIAGIAALDLAKFAIDQTALLQYIELLQQWDKLYNLTAIQGLQKMVSHHLLDSLAVLPFINGRRIIDVGSGAGLPGIPLAIALPNHNFVLLDCNNKKTRFLTHVVNSLQLTNVTVVTERAEQYHPDACFDIVITRAYAKLKIMFEQTQHLCCPQGEFFAMKGVDPRDEITALPAAVCARQIHKLKVPQLNAQRCLVVLRKSSS